MIDRSCGTCRHLAGDDPDGVMEEVQPMFCTLMPTWVEVDRDHWCGQYVASIKFLGMGREVSNPNPQYLPKEPMADAPEEAKPVASGPVKKATARRSQRGRVPTPRK